jgi:hypothetical protein
MMTNPNSVQNVNVAQGPRIGNTDAHEGKRKNSMADKADRAPLADMVMNMFSARGASRSDYVNKADQVGDNSGKRSFRKR